MKQKSGRPLLAAAPGERTKTVPNSVTSSGSVSPLPTHRLGARATLPPVAGSNKGLFIRRHQVNESLDISSVWCVGCVSLFGVGSINRYVGKVNSVGQQGQGRLWRCVVRHHAAAAHASTDAVLHK